jgi:hypothetical protein
MRRTFQRRIPAKVKVIPPQSLAGAIFAYRLIRPPPQPDQHEPQNMRTPAHHFAVEKQLSVIFSNASIANEPILV